MSQAWKTAFVVLAAALLLPACARRSPPTVTRAKRRPTMPSLRLSRARY